MSDGDRTQLLFLAGAGRSGTTLLGLLLGQLQGILLAGEVTYIWDRGFSQDQLCGCGAKFSKCPFWTEVVRVAFPSTALTPITRIVTLRDTICSLRNIPRIAYPNLRTHKFIKLYDEYTEYLRRVYRAIKEVSGCRLIIDSSKHPPELFLLRSMRSIDLSVIHLVRNSPAVVYAWQKWKPRPEIYWQAEYMPRYSEIRTALAWNVFNLLIERVQNDLPYRLIRYEDLIQNPRKSISEISALLGVRPNLDFIAHDAVQLGANHTVSGNPIRFQSGVIPLRLESEWQEQMSALRKLRVNLLTFHYQRKYGYLGTDRGGDS